MTDESERLTPERTQSRTKGGGKRPAQASAANILSEQGFAADPDNLNGNLGRDVAAFDFHGVSVRTVIKKFETWFVASDVCAVLGHRNPRQVVRRLKDDEKGVHYLDTLGGPQEVTVINESGLYAVVLRSRKSEAETFRFWVTNEVLPSIRKTGRYEAGIPGIGSGFDWLNIPGRYMTLVKSATDRTTYELPIESMIGEVTGTDVHILAHGLAAEDDLHLRRLSAVIKSAGELAARYLNYPIP
jgi:hypothetical protein